MTRPTRDDATDAIALVQAIRRGDQRAISAALLEAQQTVNAERQQLDMQTRIEER